MLTTILIITNIGTALFALEMYLQNRLFKNGLVAEFMKKMD